MGKRNYWFLLKKKKQKTTTTNNNNQNEFDVLRSVVSSNISVNKCPIMINIEQKKN